MLAPGYADPEAAFAHYAGAINAAAWCDAINTFVPAARDDVALASFRALVLLAGADNPKRSAYFERLRQLCAQHALACDSEARATQLAQSVLNGRTIEKELTGLAAQVSQGAEAMYVELMTAFSAVDAATMSKFDSSLLELELHDDRASAKAHQESGALSKLRFINTKSGWLLSVD